jgi:hypothetical protein
VLFVCCLIVVPLPPGENPFAVNNNNNNNNNNSTIGPTYNISVGNLKGTDSLVDLGEDGMILLKSILKEQNVRMLARFSYFRTLSNGGLL